MNIWEKLVLHSSGPHIRVYTYRVPAVHEYMYKDTRKESLSHSSLFKRAYTPSAVVYFSFKCHGREKSKYKINIKTEDNTELYTLYVYIYILKGTATSLRVWCIHMFIFQKGGKCVYQRDKEKKIIIRHQITADANIPLARRNRPILYGCDSPAVPTIIYSAPSHCATHPPHCAVVPAQPDVSREQRPLWVHPRAMPQARLHAVPPQTTPHPHPHSPARNKHTVVHNVHSAVMVTETRE